MSEASDFKEKGNEAFKSGDYENAIVLYTKAITLASDDNDLSIYLKNRAAANLKHGKYQQTIDDCTKSLELAPADPKTLYRRLQAYEHLHQYEQAYCDAREVLNLEPTNKLIQPILERLYKIVQQRARENSQITNKIDSMSKFAFDVTLDREKRETAMNNLLVLAREKVGSEVMLKTGILHKIKTLLKVDKNPHVYISGIRIVGEVCKHSVDNTKIVLKELGLPWFLEVIDSNDSNQVGAVEHCMQSILNSFSGMNNKPDTKPDKELCEKHKFQIDTLLSCLVYSINNHTISGLARDAIIELLIRNVHYTALNWAERLVEIGGVERLMECASELDEYKFESSLNITESTHTIAAVCLGRVFENMYYDKARDNYLQKIQGFVSSKLLAPDIESKVRVTAAITVLLRGPLDVGNTIISKEGILEMILVMANSNDVLQQRVAVECIIAAASKHDKAKAIIKQGANILKSLYKSPEPGISIRALVALCKLATCTGFDASIKPFQEGSTLKLAEACRRFLLHPGKDKDLQKWSAEGLSYLTLDAEVKEKLIEDRAALQALIQLGKSGDQSVLYGIITTLVNLCNAYEKQEILPEMVQLAQFAKQHVPQEHELDDADFVSKRVSILGQLNVASALVALSNTESVNAKELIARVFNALCSETEIRGSVVQQGGAKVLITLALNGTDKGKRHAAQALARIGVTINPEVAFPGQRSLEVIRPLLNLLHQDCSALENFEGLLALCNIAQMSEAARQRILKENGLGKIDHYLFEDHVMLRRAATQVITNLAMSPDVVEIYEGENDKMKYLVLLCMEEDLETSLAAAGAVAILTSSSTKCCSKVFDTSSWLESLQILLANPNSNLQYRGLAIIKNMMESSKDVAAKLIETNIMEILMALSKSENEQLPLTKDLAQEALKSAESWGIIKTAASIQSPDPFIQAEAEIDD
ncbi:hypothetical protein RN001_010368 [Aquatica leii]|uniref:UNC-45/Cro1/She4 central domain-containing protein n=1 Tax=Aquatica leii TaxID=1421715 RepID=A0AAN7SEE3_9COLE|nr:hypothetical protein RN001_010368 [Aquatica leii]